MRWTRGVAWGLFLLLPVIPAWTREAAKPAPVPKAVQGGDPERIRFFEKKIRPLLSQQCALCHGEKLQQGELRLDTAAGFQKGGSSGAVVLPGHPEKSLLIQAVRYDGRLKMPPQGKLKPEQIADLTAWVKMGAPWPAATAPAGKEPAGRSIEEIRRSHWAFRPVKRPAVPAVKNRTWVRNPIDAFILAKLEAKGLKPNPPASRRELIRRVTYDLTGLPPAPREVEAFVADSSPDAYSRLVDRLLASPRYGEKWGRHWLDLVRFAETNSYERDNPKPNAWRYRDYVIRSFNADKPYDRFIREQLAGDEIDPSDPEHLIATGYYRLGIWDDEPTDREQARYDGLDDIIATTGQLFLGLTLDCARCHDHKIDPIPQKDYYRLLAFFRNINHYRNGGPTDEVEFFTEPGSREAYERQVRELEQKRSDVRAELTAIETEFRKRYEQARSPEAKSPEPGARSPEPEQGPPPPPPVRGGGVDPELIKAEGARVLGPERFARYQKLRRDWEELKKQRVPADRALCVTEAGSQGPETFLLLRGNPHAQGERVEPGFPQIFGAPEPVLPQPPRDAKTTGRRLVLARWIASPENRLTARVMANRIWQHHFGRGIVRSSNDFGLQGTRPTHPELLDWLATEFIRQGWRLKPLHRLIVTSSAYRMSSRGNPQALKRDPANDLFWRYDMRRLTAEEVRDSILAVTGSLNLKMYGPGIYPEMPAEVLAGQSMPGHGWGKSPPEEQNRRSIYIHVKRSLLTPILESFDLAETDLTTPARFATTQPTQALLMLNSDFLGKQAEAFTARLRREAGEDADRQVRLALSLSTQRPPTAEEVRRGVRLIEALKTEEGAADDVALKHFCLMVLNMNEFVYLD